MPWLLASLTMKAWLRVHLDAAPDASCRCASAGCRGRPDALGSLMSTNEVPVVRPMRAYSRPVSGSVQPHTSLPCAAADLGQRQEGQQVDVVAGVDAGEAAHARRWSDRADANVACRSVSLPRSMSSTRPFSSGSPGYCAPSCARQISACRGGRDRREQEVRADQRQRHRNVRRETPDTLTVAPLSFPGLGRARRTYETRSPPGSAPAPTFSDGGRRPMVVSELLESRHPRGPTLHLEPRRRSTT